MRCFFELTLVRPWVTHIGGLDRPLVAQVVGEPPRSLELARVMGSARPPSQRVSKETPIVGRSG